MFFVRDQTVKAGGFTLKFESDPSRCSLTIEHHVGSGGVASQVISFRSGEVTRIVPGAVAKYEDMQGLPSPVRLDKGY